MYGRNVKNKRARKSPFPWSKECKDVDFGILSPAASKSLCMIPAIWLVFLLANVLRHKKQDWCDKSHKLGLKTHHPIWRSVFDFAQALGSKMANSADLSSWVVSIETMGEIRIELRIGDDIGLNIRTESHFITSLTGKTASLALLTLRERVKGVCPLGIELLRLYLFSSDVILLLPSSDEDTSV